MPRLLAPIRYFGGKGVMAKRILPLLPKCKTYVEPYCGGASMFFTKESTPTEVLNDLDENVIKLFRAIRSKGASKLLRERLHWTPNSRSELALSLQILKDKRPSVLDIAWAMFVAHNQGMHGVTYNLLTPGQWSRALGTISGGMAATSNRWQTKIGMIDHWHKRLHKGVQLFSMDAFQVIKKFDTKDTLFYIDPPYTAKSRRSVSVYLYEVDDKHHRDLVRILLKVKGKVVLSGYDSPLYFALERVGWVKHSFETRTSTASNARGSKAHHTKTLESVPRREVLWVKGE